MVHQAMMTTAGTRRKKRKRKRKRKREKKGREREGASRGNQEGILSHLMIIAIMAMGRRKKDGRRRSPM